MQTSQNFTWAQRPLDELRSRAMEELRRRQLEDLRRWAHRVREESERLLREAEREFARSVEP